MKKTVLLFFTGLLALPIAAQAESPFASLQSAKQKNTLLKDSRKMCSPKASMSDAEWEKTLMSSEANKDHIHEAIVAMERNNQKNYWLALEKVEYPDM